MDKRRGRVSIAIDFSDGTFNQPPQQVTLSSGVVQAGVVITAVASVSNVTAIPPTPLGAGQSYSDMYEASIDSHPVYPWFSLAAEASCGASLSSNGQVLQLNVSAESDCQTIFLGSPTSSAIAGGQMSLSVNVSSAITIHVGGSLDAPVAGRSQSYPLLFNNPPCGFALAPTGSWFDPPLALGYDFQQTGSSLFTDILSLPIGIDGDGLFEVFVGTQSLGQFAQGSRVDFRQLLGGNGVQSFRIAGIDPAADASNAEAFPVKLAFDTPLASFSMCPVTWRKVGASCSDPAACVTCPTVSLEPVGQAVTGNTSFSLAMQNGPTGGIGAFYLGIGHPQANPIPLFCGAVYPQLPVLELGVGFLTGTGTCDGAGSIALPLPNDPVFFGLFATAQSAFLCPAGGIGLTHGIEFPIGS